MMQDRDIVTVCIAYQMARLSEWG